MSCMCVSVCAQKPLSFQFVLVKGSLIMSAVICVDPCIGLNYLYNVFSDIKLYLNAIIIIYLKNWNDPFASLTQTTRGKQSFFASRTLIPASLPCICLGTLQGKDWVVTVVATSRK